MPTFYECTRCGDLFKDKDQTIYLSSYALRKKLDWESSSVDLCPQCAKPFFVFLLGYLGQGSKISEVDGFIDREYNFINK